MSVGRRLILSLATLVTCTGLLGAAAIIGLGALSQHYRIAEEQYNELRALYEVGFQAASLRDLLTADAPDQQAIRRRLFAAGEAAERLGVASADGNSEMLSVRASILSRLKAVSEQVDSTGAGPELREDAQRWLGQIANSAATTQAAIIDNRERASAEFRVALGLLVGLFGVSISVAVFVGVRQYRSVMRPLRNLEIAMRQIADARLDHRIGMSGDREFVQLMKHFNAMSDAIEDLHRSMKEQIDVKSRQLLRSEQLAGVGYLAAGLAHEINNPLAIITGHAQRMLRRMEKRATPGVNDAELEAAASTLRLVCEEAFRCRDIAVRLLRLSQPDDREPEPTPMDALVQQTIELLRPLPVCKGREVAHTCHDAAERLVCLGRPAQLVQVLINLLTNALEACPAVGGRVEVRVQAQLGKIHIVVSDNGCGMNSATLEHAFDPFFTDKPRRGLGGSGLGLSVSHAIIERHEGRLYAQSDGVGRGSRFTVELPLAESSATSTLLTERDYVGIE